jgi:hypothetical protein
VAEVEPTRYNEIMRACQGLFLASTEVDQQREMGNKWLRKL